MAGRRCGCRAYHGAVSVTTRLITRADVPVLVELMRANRAFLAPWEPMRTDDFFTVEHQEHSFTFAGHDHVAEYLATNPKYDLAPGLYGNAGALAATLHEFLPDRPLTTTSLVTFVVAQSAGGRW